MDNVHEMPVETKIMVLGHLSDILVDFRAVFSTCYSFISLSSEMGKTLAVHDKVRKNL